MKTRIVQAIETKYLSATHTKGARIKATAAGGFSITMEIDFELSDVENHAKAAKLLAAQVYWNYPLIHGVTKGSNHVFVPYVTEE